FALLLVTLISFGPVTFVQATGNSSQPSSNATYAIITFSDAPLAAYQGHIAGLPATAPSPGQKLDLNSQAAQSYSSHLSRQRDIARTWLARNAPEVQIIYEYSTILNGIAVKLNGHNLNHLFSIPGVVSVVPSTMYHLDMNRSPTLIGAPVLWSAVGGQSNAGAGIKIGILDTGIRSEVQIIYEYSTILNGIAVKLNGHNLNHLFSIPGVVSVVPSTMYHLDMNRSPTLIGAPVLWSAVGGQSNAGAGIKIGILDTGIDTTHPFLTDNALTVPKGYPKCDALDSAVHKVDTSCLYTSNKVLV